MARSRPGSGPRRFRSAWMVALVILSCGTGLGWGLLPDAGGAAGPAPDRDRDRDRVGPAGTGTGRTTGVGRGAAEIRLPLDPYVLSPHEMRTIGRAHGALVRACMARFGFHLPAPADPVNGMRFARHERRYGVLDETTAAKYGYQAPAEVRADRAAVRNRPPATGAEITAYTGRGLGTVNGVRVPDGGCTRDAGRALNLGRNVAAGGLQQPLALRLGLESYERSQRDGRVTAAFGRWSRCMEARGYRYPDPMTALADPRFDGGTSPEQVATAVTDVTCKRRTGLVEVWSAVEAEHQRRQILANQAELNLLRKANQAQVTRAVAILAGAGTHP
jgi:hypothetical protein